MKQRQKARKQIIINCEKLEKRVAFINHGKLEEYKIERAEEGNIVGSIFLGRIANLEPSLNAAFVDIGGEKNAFLHYWDMIPATYDMVERISSTQRLQDKKPRRLADKIRNLIKGRRHNYLQEIDIKRRKIKKVSVDDIPKLFPVGSPIIVQVTKDAIGTKGPRVTTNISIPGRYLVLLPNASHIGLSKKIEDPEERQRLKKILRELDVPSGIGLICRTNAEGRKAVFFKRDLSFLLRLWHNVEERLQNPVIPCELYSAPSLLERTVRDFLTEDIDRIIIDNPQEYQALKIMIKNILGRSPVVNRLQLYKDPEPIFEYYNIESQIEAIYQREVQLPSGGYICIDESEALIAIDVNTGHSTSGKKHSETFLKTNLEACEEIARQLRLRNVGGLVVIDFIDMASPRDKQTVYKYMRELVREDRAKSTILPISKLGLMEMTRQREKESLQTRIFSPCPYCHGRGKVKSALTISVEIQRRLREIMRKYSGEKELTIRVVIHPTILARLKNNDADVLLDLERKYGQQLSFRADNTLHLEQFKLIDPETGVEYYNG